MSDSIKDGGPAFPYLTASETDREVTTHEGERGMTLRDYFAAKAMQSAFTSPIAATSAEKEYIAMHSYAMADAMLKARMP